MVGAQGGCGLGGKSKTCAETDLGRRAEDLASRSVLTKFAEYLLDTTAAFGMPRDLRIVRRMCGVGISPMMDSHLPYCHDSAT